MMKFRDFLPFEISYLDSEKTIDENKTKVKIFSRNNAFFIFAYIFFMIVGIYGLIKMIIMKNYIGILFLILWILFIFILTNFIHKKSRKEEIIFIERKLN